MARESATKMSNAGSSPQDKDDEEEGADDNVHGFESQQQPPHQLFEDDEQSEEECEPENEEERTLRSLEQMIAAVEAQFNPSTASFEDTPTTSNTTSRPQKPLPKTTVGRKRMRTLSPSSASAPVTDQEHFIESDADHEWVDNNKGGGRGGRGKGIRRGRDGIGRGSTGGRVRTVRATTKTTTSSSSSSSATVVANKVTLKSSSSSILASTNIITSIDSSTASAIEDPTMSIAAMLAELEGLTESVLSTHLPN